MIAHCVVGFIFYIETVYFLFLARNLVLSVLFIFSFFASFV